MEQKVSISACPHDCPSTCALEISHDNARIYSVKGAEKNTYTAFTTMDGDDTVYQVEGFDPMVMLPDEDIYKPKKTECKNKKGLENFMDDVDIDKVVVRGEER